MAEIMQKSKVIEFIEGLNFSENPTKVQSEARQALNAMDFPTTRVEDWKYTRVTRITKKKFNQNRADVDASPFFIPKIEAHKLVFINGYFDEKQSQILNDDAISVKAIEELDYDEYTKCLEDTDENVFSLINKAYANDGNFIEVAKNKKAKYPIQVVNLVSGDQNIGQ